MGWDLWFKLWGWVWGEFLNEGGNLVGNVWGREEVEEMFVMVGREVSEEGMVEGR